MFWSIVWWNARISSPKYLQQSPIWPYKLDDISGRSSMKNTIIYFNTHSDNFGRRNDLFDIIDVIFSKIWNGDWCILQITPVLWFE